MPSSSAKRVRVDPTPLFDPPHDPWAGAEAFIDDPGLMPRPRPYQRAAFLAIIRSLDRGLCSLTYVLPTGTGKTVVFAYVIKYVTEKLGWRVLILAHLGELLKQARGKLESLGVEAAIEKAELDAQEEIEQSRHSLVRKEILSVLGSRQTLFGKRLARWDRDYFDLIIIDECHHAYAESYRNIIGHFRKAVVVGATATDYRMDEEENIYDIFQDRVFVYPPWEARQNGHLCEPRVVKAADVRIDLRNIKLKKGDFSEGHLSKRIMEHLGPIANSIREKLEGRKIIVFVPHVKVAYTLAEMLVSIGVAAEAVDGKNPERESIAERFKRDEFRCLVNVGLFTEGYDEDSIDAVVLARPTKSLGLLTQMIGRGLRPGKPECKILDFQWQLDENDIASVVDIFARPGVEPRALKLARERIDQGIDDDPTKAIENAEAELKRRDDEEKARRPLDIFHGAKAHKKDTGWDYVERDLFAGKADAPPAKPRKSIGPDMTPEDWKPTDKLLSDQQASVFKKFRVPESVYRLYSYRQAQRVLNQFYGRSRAKLSSYAQVMALASKGIEAECGWGMTYVEASQFLDRSRMLGK